MNFKLVNYSDLLDTRQAKKIIATRMKAVFEDDITKIISKGNSSFTVNLNKGSIIAFFNIYLITCSIIFYKERRAVTIIDLNGCTFDDLLDKVITSILNVDV